MSGDCDLSTLNAFWVYSLFRQQWILKMYSNLIKVIGVLLPVSFHFCTDIFLRKPVVDNPVCLTWTFTLAEVWVSRVLVSFIFIPTTPYVPCHHILLGQLHLGNQFRKVGVEQFLRHLNLSVERKSQQFKLSCVCNLVWTAKVVKQAR